MIFIAHRGLTDGPNRLRENTLEQILSAICQDFIAEIDVWGYQDSWWLGHHEPQHLVDDNALQLLSRACGNDYQHLLMHMKNAEGFRHIFDDAQPRHFFWHESDRFTVTSYGWQIENINEQEPAWGTIINQPELHDFFLDDSHLNVGLCERFLRKYGMNAMGVMTKYPRLFAEAWEKIQNG